MPKAFSLILCLVALGGAWRVAATEGQRPAAPQVADSFGPPLGAHDDVAYGHFPHTAYDVQNWFLDGHYAPCFDRYFDELWHAGEDWFELADTRATAGDPVTAVANGTVVHVSNGNYPGKVIVIEHELPDGDIVYSMYGHVRGEDIAVVPGQTVTKGEVIATVLEWPGYPPNSHLHWEMRTFYDGGDLCTVEDISVGVPGPGYTYPGHPGAAGYLGPSAFLANHRQVRPERMSVALIIDASERMVAHDSGEQRLAAARAFVDAARPGDSVAIVTFNDSAQIAVPLLTIDGDADRQLLKDAIDAVGAAGATNLNAALDGGRLALEAGDGPRAAILLSDGQHTAGESYDPGRYDAYANGGWPLYTVGLGGSVDAARMSQIAFDTGGRFTILVHPDDLAVAHGELAQHLLHNQRLRRTTRHLETGAATSLEVAVPKDSASARFAAGWTAGDVGLTLTAPSGRQIPAPESEADVTAATGPTFARLTVAYPEPGTWTVHVHGDDVPDGGQTVALDAAADGPERRRLHLPLLVTAATAGARPAAPPPPAAPFPADGNGNAPLDVTLSWSASSTPSRQSANDSYGQTTYDVYLGLSPDALLRVAAGREQTTYRPGPLTAGETYTWQIVAHTAGGRTTSGPLWTFTTVGGNEP